ncbi:nucleotidyltransferase family protein [Kineococcus esterisolvens]|uniref:hypothetical protein n=1 Tax=unclassified Kineococcus TaxID=2621656 RepID=UPI003D7DBB60
MEKLSNSQLKKIGKALVDGSETDDQLNQLDELLSRCDEVQVQASEVLARSLSSVTLTSGGKLEVRGRAKTLITLREKLVRMGGQALPVIRDLAGLRIVGDMTITEQDMVLNHACDALGVSAEQRKIIDRRQIPMRGYRALHAEFQLDEVRVELQVRTQLQHVWAEVYERAGDKLGRSIRYPNDESSRSATPEIAEFIGTMENFSAILQQLEDARSRISNLSNNAVGLDPSTGEPFGISDVVAEEAKIRSSLTSKLVGIGRMLDELPVSKEAQ